MNPALLVALGASVLFGAADFSGGLAAKRAPAPLVTAFSCLGALLVLFLAMPFVQGTPTASDLAWGAATGACGAAGATLIYASLALGPAIVASPVFSVIGLVVPVLFGLFLGERPSPIAWAGVGLAVLCIPLLSWSTEGAGGYTRAHLKRTLFVATMAGLVIGWFLICVARIGSHAGLLPLVVARGVAIALFAAWFLIARKSLVPAAGARPLALGAGALDSGANVAYWFAAHGASIALAATLVSLAPATTVLLARATLGERWSVPQRLGLALALVAGGLIAHG